MLIGLEAWGLGLRVWMAGSPRKFCFSLVGGPRFLQRMSLQI